MAREASALDRTERFRSLPPSEPRARYWTHAAIARDAGTVFRALPAAAMPELEAAMAFVQANGITLDTVEQEDVRLPAFAREVPALRRVLDSGPGFAVLRGVDAARWSEAEAEIIAWALCNYLGQTIRQGIDHDRRLFTVADKGASNTDPTRIGASPKRSAKHSDNGCLEPRPPCYIGLYCHRSAAGGGDSTLITARTIFETIAAERPDLLPLYFERYHFRAPRAHVWPSRGPTIQKPIFEIAAGELRVHYARVMIEPGMEMAGTPLTPVQRAALDYFDEVIERPELCFRHALRPGELLVLNNLALLHGREAFSAGSGGRTLKRVWMWRRHIGPGIDPVALDLEEFA